MRLSEKQTQVAKIIHSNPGLSRLELLKITASGWSNQHIKLALDSLIGRALVIEKSNVLSLEGELGELMESIAKRGKPIAPRVTNKMQGTMSKKYLIGQFLPREGCELRDVSFKSLVSNVPVSVKSYD